MPSINAANNADMTPNPNDLPPRSTMSKNSPPPAATHPLRYEVLQREEKNLTSAREDLLKNNSNSSNNDEQIRHLNVRTLFHRTSLQCLIQSAQHVARKNSKHEDVAHLQALWKERSDTIDVTLGLPNCIGSGHNNNHTNDNIINASSDDEQEPLDDSADIFFETYPELARPDDEWTYSSSDESVVEVEIKKRKGDSKDEPIVVSGEDSPKDLHNNFVDRNSLPMNRRNELEKASNSQPQNNLNSRQFNNNVQSRSNHQQSQVNNPYHQQHQNQHQNQPHQLNRQKPPLFQQQQQQQHNQWQNRPSTGCFDYNETNQNRHAKENPFRTAKEVQGTIDNNAPDNWDDGRQNDNNGYSRNKGRSTNNTRGWGNQEDEEPHRGNNTMNNRANNTSRPQELVKTALNGPKQNVSQGLKKKYQNPRLGSNNNNGNANSNNGGQTNKPRNSNSNGGNNDDDDELPEELKGLNKDLIERIQNDIVDSGEKVTFADIAGLDHAKSTVVSACTIHEQHVMFVCELIHKILCLERNDHHAHAQT